MKKLLTIVLTTALCTPVFAQRMGATNNNAPTLEQSITSGGTKITLNYTSITWAEGRTVARLMDKEKGAPARERVNSTAPNEPLAKFTTSVPVACGDLKLDAGDYKTFFTVSDACEWQLNFQGKDGKVATMKLPLSEGHEESPRLLMCLYAGKAEGAAGVYLAFGKQMGMLEFAPAKAAEDGPEPTVMVALTALVAPLITETVLAPWLTT